MTLTDQNTRWQNGSAVLMIASALSVFPSTSQAGIEPGNGSFAHVRQHRNVIATTTPNVVKVFHISVPAPEASTIEPVTLEQHIAAVEEEGDAALLSAARQRLAARMARARSEQPQKTSLRQLRLAAGLSQADLAQRLGSDQGYVSRLESGKAQPKRDRIVQLAEIFGASPDVIIEALNG